MGKKKLPLNPYSLLRVDGIIYQQIVTSDIREGDLLVDIRDHTFGVCDMVLDNHVAMRDGPVVEVDIPKWRVRKLVPALENNSLN